MKILYINPARIEAGLDALTKTQPLSLITIAAMVPDHDAKLIDFKVDRYGISTASISDEFKNMKIFLNK